MSDTATSVEKRGIESVVAQADVGKLLVTRTPSASPWPSNAATVSAPRTTGRSNTRWGERPGTRAADSRTRATRGPEVHDGTPVSPSVQKSTTHPPDLSPSRS